MSEETQHIIAVMEPVLRKHGVVRSSLFGSFARGDQTPESDVDVLVEFPKGVGMYKYMALKRELETVLNRPVDIVTFRSLHQRLRPYVARDAVALY